jgi:hypothetical protein
MSNWQQSPHGLDPIATEHRLTHAEAKIVQHGEHHLEHFEIAETHRDKLNLLERAILFLAAAVAILAQDRFPAIVKLLRGVVQ